MRLGITTTQVDPWFSSILSKSRFDLWFAS